MERSVQVGGHLNDGTDVTPLELEGGLCVSAQLVSCLPWLRWL
jgi:hypothetical protein